MKSAARNKLLPERIRRLFAPRSLRFQLLSRSLLILLGLLLFIGLFQFLFMQQFLFQNKAASIQSQIRSVPSQVWARLLSDPQRDGDFDRRDAEYLAIPDSNVAFVDLNGTVHALYSRGAHGKVPQLKPTFYQKALQPQKHGDDGEAAYHIIEDEHGDGQLIVLSPLYYREQTTGLVQVSTRVEPLQHVLFSQLAIFLVLAAVALLAGLLTLLPILRRTLVPLSQMVDTVERINAGNLDERLQTELSQLEIERLSASFNGMLERLQHSFETEKEARETMRRFVADASHELRTPLTSIRGFLEVLLRGAANNPEQLQRALQSMHGESERLSKLVQDLLTLARLDRTPQAEKTDGRLDRLLSDMEPQLRMLAGEREVALTLTTEQASWFDADRIKQVILNLFQNAVQHTDPQQGRIAVCLQEQADGLLLTFEDNGTGIAEEHLAQLFDRFYRVDSARSRMHGGAGLGLSITKTILDIHGGTISCTSQPGQGTVFEVWLPLR
ncbi:two-component system OmpR family sensor kinase [Tumebacillus sp. BK434]|uniref:sensor histidine kinase n=1 Tax=Tumebacillus sp. BK434 TaxID=2512169 RepID=UPI00104BF761|nr:HAMP domain-containing sensor histidine kinase [Tumebacillus sp. BK434]TCP52181.1 two-component system OmpR family sensor kinase [Tumebacillus sp. BK434]